MQVCCNPGFGNPVAPLWEETRDGTSVSPSIRLTATRGGATARPPHCSGSKIPLSPVLPIALSSGTTALGSGARAGAEGWRLKLSLHWLETVVEGLFSSACREAATWGG